MKYINLFMLLVLPCCLAAQKISKKLEPRIQEATSGFNGDIGVYIKELKTGRTITLNADSIFPTASIVKVPILVGVMDKLHRKELDYLQELTYRDSLLYAGEDILGSFKSDEKIAVGKVIMLMLTMSDNTASLWLQSLAGTGTRINTIMDSIGLSVTRVNSRTAGREKNWQQYGWGQTSPREMATLFEKIYNREIISPEHCDKMMRLLSRNFWDTHALSEVPPTTAVFSKNGAVDGSRSEVLLVNDCKNPYILCVFTKKNKDKSWEDNNEAWMLAKQISRLTWEHMTGTKKRAQSK